MGMLIDGAWHTDAARGNESGAFERERATFRNWVTPDGEAGPTGSGGFEAEPDRYHLYVSAACPWAHRALIARRLKGLRHLVGVTIADPVMGAGGWTYPGGGDITGVTRHFELYQTADPRFTGRATVPVLWDRDRETIVNNESADILRMFDHAFDAYTEAGPELCPPGLVSRIDALNADVYQRLNNGVYRAGFATRQSVYDAAVRDVFGCLAMLDERLTGQRYLHGGTLTESDVRVFTTLVRFDAVYYVHFKCNICRVVDFTQLRDYARDLYQTPDFHETVDFEHIKQHYYRSHPELNPNRIVPIGPDGDWWAAHGRDRLDASPPSAS